MPRLPALRAFRCRLVVAVLVAVAWGSAAAEARLPRTVFPHHYDLVLTPDLATDTFAGRATIEVGIQLPVREIVLNAAELEIDEASVAAGGVVHPARVSYQPEEETATLTVDEPLAVGPATLSLRYRGTLNDDLRGFYLGRMGERKYAATQLEATDARRAFPSWDEPEFKATFAVTLVVDEELAAISNGLEVSSTPGPGPGQRTVRFATTPRMSTYLVALIVGDFACLEDEQDGVPLRVCAAPEKVELGRFAMAETKRLLPFFVEWFGIPYPFAKLDQIGIPDFAAGAMENTGAILYRETALLLDAAASSVKQQKRVAAVVAHEIAHHWFGDLVTMEWWDDIWLNEGFADFMEGRALAELHPEWEMEVAEAAATGWPLATDVLVSTRPIRQQAETPAEIEELFDGIAYGKAAAVLRMLAGWAGEEDLRAGIHRFLAARAFANASADDFFGALADASGKPIDAVMRSFVTQPGVPVVRVAGGCEGDETVLELSQERFYATPRAGEGSQEAARWLVPVCFASGPCVLLDEARDTVRLPGCDPAPFANAGGQGYYLTAYDSDLLSGVTAGIAARDAAERLVLLRDAWYLAEAGAIPLDAWLVLARGLRGETDFRVVEELVGSLEVLAEDLVAAEDRAELATLVREVLGPVAAEVGWAPVAGEDPQRRELRGLVHWAMGEIGRDPGTLTQGRELARRYLADRAAVDPSLANAVVELAAIEGDAGLWEAYLAASKAAATPEESRRFLDALAEFEDPALVERTLRALVDGTVRSQDTRRLLAALGRRPAAGRVAWAFLAEQWDEVAANVPAQDHGRLLPAAARSFCTASERRALVAAAERRRIEGGERELAQSLEKIDQCIRRRELHGATLARWLAEGMGEARVEDVGGW